MSERSQIYVAINGKLEVANNYSGNYGNQMMSRARYGMEYIISHIDNALMLCRDDVNNFELFRRYWDVNFDTKEILLSTDMIKDKPGSLFNCDNDDGKLLVSVNSETNEIRYCFTDNYNKLMKVDEYLNWDCDVQHWRNNDIPGWNDHTRNTCSGNTNRIKKIGQLMTQQEMDEFMKLK